MCPNIAKEFNRYDSEPSKYIKQVGTFQSVHLVRTRFQKMQVMRWIFIKENKKVKKRKENTLSTKKATRKKRKKARSRP